MNKTIAVVEKLAKEGIEWLGCKKCGKMAYIDNYAKPWIEVNDLLDFVITVKEKVLTIECPRCVEVEMPLFLWTARNIERLANSYKDSVERGAGLGFAEYCRERWLWSDV